MHAANSHLARVAGAHNLALKELHQVSMHAFVVIADCDQGLSREGSRRDCVLGFLAGNGRCLEGMNASSDCLICAGQVSCMLRQLAALWSVVTHLWSGTQ